ncbi:MAG: hypothetical protein EXR27_13025 [Betaproteobacteria bacterium]|nr:hypothetical protein [Betaproteobacteria bacterium]
MANKSTRGIGNILNFAGSSGFASRRGGRTRSISRLQKSYTCCVPQYNQSLIQWIPAACSQRTRAIALSMAASILAGCATLGLVGSTVPPYRSGQTFVRGTCIPGPAREPCPFAFHLVRDDADHILLLSRLSARDAQGKALFTVSDSFAPIPIGSGDAPLLGLCGPGRHPDATIFAVVETHGEAAWRGSVRFALKANLDLARLERIEIADLACSNGESVNPFGAQLPI